MKVSFFTIRMEVKPMPLGIFVKFGGRTAIHHNKPMPSDYASIAITSSLPAFDSLPFPQFDHDPPLLTIKDAMGYVVLWAWKLIDKYMKISSLF